MIKKRIRTWNSEQQNLTDGGEKAEYCRLSSSAQMEMQKGYKSISRLSHLIGWLRQLSLGRHRNALEKHAKSEACTLEESGLLGAVRKAAHASSLESIKSTPLVIQVRSNELSRGIS